MEETSVNKPEIAETSVKEVIIKGYKEYYLTHGHDPESIYVFCKELGISEVDFYQHYNSFDQIRSAYWSFIFNSVVDKMKSSPEYTEFSVREKMLSFCYAFFERLKQDRSFALLSMPFLLNSIM